MFQKCSVSYIRISYRSAISFPSSSRIITGSGWSTTFDIHREISRTILIPRIEEAKRVPLPVISGSRPQGETSKISFSTVTNQRGLWNIPPPPPSPSPWTGSTIVVGIIRLKKDTVAKGFSSATGSGKRWCKRERKKEKEKERKERVSLKEFLWFADSLVFSLVREMARERKMDGCY